MNITLIQIIILLVILFVSVYRLGAIHASGFGRLEKRKQREELITPLDDLFEGKHAHEYPVPTRPNSDIVPQTVRGNYPPKGTRKAVKSLRQGHWLWSVLFPREQPARKGSEMTVPEPPEPIPAAEPPGYILRDSYVPRTVHGNYASFKPKPPTLPEMLKPITFGSVTRK